MRFLPLLLSLLLAVSAHAEESLRVVASVLTVREYRAPMKPGVYVDFIVHVPAEFQGLPITMFTGEASRRTRRAEFPIGAQFTLQLPDAAVAALKTAKVHDEHIEHQIDNGVDPRAISDFVPPVQIDLAALATKPTRVEVR